MKEKRFLLDSTLRDGEQMPGVCFTDGQKLKIAALLDESGVHQIEAGIPAVSKQERINIAKIAENRRNAVISVWARLVPSDIKKSLETGADMVHISVPISYPHIYSKLRKNKNWVIKQLYSCLELTAKKGIAVSVGFEDAFRSEAAFMYTVTEILLEFGVKRIRLSDTVGLAYPSLCRSVIGDFSAMLGGRAELGFHGHNDLQLAVANTVESAKSGCMYADVTARGIGERAGNCDLARLVSASGHIFDWGISPDSAQKLQEDIFAVINDNTSKIKQQKRKVKIMKIAIFTDGDLKLCNFFNAERFIIKEKDGDKWKFLREEPFESLKPSTPDSTRKNTEALLPLISDCDVIAGGRLGGIPFTVFDAAGLKIFGIASADDSTLDGIVGDLENEKKQRTEKESAVKNARPTETETKGVFTLDLVKLQSEYPEISSKMAMKEFMETTPFSELILTCKHIPPWIENSDKYTVGIISKNGVVNAVIKKVVG